MSNDSEEVVDVKGESEEMETANLTSQSDKIRVHFLMKRSLYSGLEDVASDEDTTVSDVARKAIREYVRKHKSKMKG